jgi:putative glutamine amidotransferase
MKPRIAITASPMTHDNRLGCKVNRSYVDAVVRAGAIPLLVPVLAPALSVQALMGLDGLLLTGGGDVSPSCYGEEPVSEVYGVNTDRDQWELALVAAAQRVGLPILGVCRGAQILNVATGGTLVQHLPDVSVEPHGLRIRESEEVHPVGIDPDSLLATVVGTEQLGVNSLHHQALALVGTGLRAVAWAPDGIIEAVEGADHEPILAVQWHPELMSDHPRHQKLFNWLVEAASSSSTTESVQARSA